MAAPDDSSPTSNYGTAAALAAKTASAPVRTPGCGTSPLHDFAANQLWLELVALATDLLAWTQMLALHDHPARRWEPKRLRLRLFTTAGRLARSGRRLHLRLPTQGQWADLIATAISRLQTLPAP